MVLPDPAFHDIKHQESTNKTNVSVCDWRQMADIFPYTQVELQADYNFLPNLCSPFIHQLHWRHKFERSRSISNLRRESELFEFHDLVEREIPRLRRYARALTRDADRADDLVQDTLLRAISKSHLWQFGTDLRAWLFTIMHNQHVNVVRPATRMPSTSSSYRPRLSPAVIRRHRGNGTN